MKKIINKLDENGENLLKMRFNVKSTPHNTMITVSDSDGYDYPFEIIPDRSNCKLSYVNRIGNLQYFSDDQRKEIIKKILSACAGMVIFNTIYQTAAQFLTDNYQVYYYNTPPVGYGANGVQHHICIKNHIKQNHHCRTPEGENYQKFGIRNIKSKLKKILKEKRRKDDYVDDFIKSL